MKLAVFSTKPYDRDFLTAANREHGHALRFLEARLSAESAALARGWGAEAVCAFVGPTAGMTVPGRAQAPASIVRTKSARSAGPAFGRIAVS